MNISRRGFLAGAGILTLVGCARVNPVGVITPSATLSAKPTVFTIFGETSPAEIAVRSLLTQRLISGGFAAERSDLPSNDVNAILLDLRENPTGLAVSFAQTMLNILDSDDEGTVDELLPTLAGLVGTEINLLNVTPLDGRIIWAVAPTRKIVSLKQLHDWSRPKGKPAKTLKVGIPAFAGIRGDGLPALDVVYEAKVESVYLENPVARREALLAGSIQLAGFRACDFFALDGLTKLLDPIGVTRQDPLTVMLNARLTQEEPNAALAILDVVKALNMENFWSLEQQIAAGDDPDQAAQKWLSTMGFI